MKAMIDAKKDELKTEDAAKIKAELEKDPVWNDLHSQMTNANAKAAAQRNKLLGTTRARITPPRHNSKPASK